MHKEFLMGNAAIALGAVAAGVNVVAGYPGTPSTEVLETSWQNTGRTDVYVEWSVNEKAAMELAAGAAYAGARSMVTMKQVGLTCGFRSADEPGVRRDQRRNGHSRRR